MKRILLVILSCLYFCSCVDERSQTDQKKMTAILETAEEAILTQKVSQTDSMMQLRMDYFRKAAMFEDSIHMYRAHFYLGSFYQSRGIYKDAMSEYEKALQTISDDADSARYIQTKVAIATTEIELGNKYKAGNILLEAYEVAQRNNRTLQLIHINGNMGILSLELTNYQDAKKSFKEAITTIERKKLIEKDSVNYVENYINYHMFMAKAYQAEQSLDSAMLYIDKGIEIANHFRDIEGKAYLYELKGKTATSQQNFSEAYENLTNARRIFENLGNEKQLSKIIFLLANYHYEKGEYTEALSLLNELQRRYKENHLLLTDHYDALVLQADVYKAMKAFEQESDYRQQSSVVQDTIQANENKQTVIQTATQYEIEKIRDQYELLHKKDEKRFYIFVFVVILFVAISGAFLYKRLSRRKAATTSTSTTQETETKEKKEPQSTIKSDKTVEEILQKLKKLEADEFYLNPKYNLYATAKKIDTNTTYLSSILNAHKKMTFTEYLNNLRIQYTLERLQNDSKFKMYTIKAIAKEVGYKSHGSFSRAFKAKTGENPSTYLKRIRE